MLHENSKWKDEEDLKTFEEEEVPMIHRKLIKKNKVLAEGLREFSQAKTSSKFTAWATPQGTTKSVSKASALLKQEDLLQTAKKPPAVYIKKVAQTAIEDSLGSVVQTIDKSPSQNLYAFGGFDKVLKLCRLTFDKKKNYEIRDSLYFEGLPIVNSCFCSDSQLALSFLKKSFFSFYDIEKGAHQYCHKIFANKSEVEKICLSPSKRLTLVSSKTSLTLMDNRLKNTGLQSQQSSQIIDTTFLKDNLVAVALKNFNILLLDVRKSLALPSQSLSSDCSKITGNASYLVTGNKNGIVKMYDLDNGLNNIKVFDQLSTLITTLSISENHLVFCSKWKKNAARVVDLESLKLVPQWPNVKTRLNIISSAHVDDAGLVSFGTSRGNLHVYQLNKSQ